MKSNRVPNNIPSNESDVVVPIREPAAAPRGSGVWLKRSLWILAATAAAVAAYVAIPHYLRTPADNVIRSSGRIEGREVTLAPKDIQGRVRKLYVDEGATVKQGQLLAELESNQLEARSALVEANIANLDAQIEQATMDLDYTRKSTDASVSAAEASVGSAEAHLERARAVLATAKIEYDRTANLLNEGLVPRSALDQATMGRRTSEADLDASEKDLAHSKATLTAAIASRDTVNLKAQQVRALQQSRRSVVAQLAEARANLAERQIVAPMDGTILSRTAEVGKVVSPGSPIFVMVDLNRLYVKVYVPEPQIAKLRLGEAADVTVDAFPGKVFHATISKIYEQAEFTPKNVETPDERVKLVFGVELSIANEGGVLKPGMPADCVIHWESASPVPVANEP